MAVVLWNEHYSVDQIRLVFRSSDPSVVTFRRGALLYTVAFDRGILSRSPRTATVVGVGRHLACCKTFPRFRSTRIYHPARQYPVQHGLHRGGSRFGRASNYANETRVRAHCESSFVDSS